MARPVYVKLNNDRYCFTCGSKVERKPYIMYYCEETGEPVMNETRVCPNQRWYRFSHAVTEAESYACQGM